MKEGLTLTVPKRLLENFTPINYQLYLDINRSAKLIQGKTTIKGIAKNAKIYLHQKFLTIKTVNYQGQALKFKVDDENETFSFQIPQTGEIELEITYQTQLTDTMMGIYPSYYQLNGKNRQIIGTQFETTFARQAFPCIDEPAAKATFELALKFDEMPGETVLANMPEKACQDGVHYFLPTVKMSTYLVAFAFGELQAKYAETKSGVKIGVFATKAHQAKELEFALDIATRSIEFFEDYYQTPYPLPHSWQLALPDFSAGAMENWGLVTYREAYLTLDPDNTPLSTKQVVASVIAHELAHQWFGDLVTMNWWDDLWLNESFANMMEYVALDALQPDWHIWEMFQQSEVSAALNRDATAGVQAVHVEVEDPAEIDSIFDSAIVYAKGSRLLVMVRDLIGDDALRTGLKNYFAQHQYANSVGDDLWQALEDASNMEIKKIMHAWLQEPGYPVLKASVQNGRLILAQSQFFVGQHPESKNIWPLPLHANFATPKLMDQAQLDLGDYQTLRQAAGQPLRFNLGANSHFIVQYDTTLWKDLKSHLADLDAISQRQILQDYQLLAKGMVASYADIINLLEILADSHSAMVTAKVYEVAHDLKQFVTPQSTEETALKSFYKRLSAKNAQRLGLTKQISESNDDLLSRPIVLKAALYGHNEEIIDQLHQIFISRDNLLALPSDIRGLILSNEVQNFGTKKLLDNFFETYQTTSDPSLKVDLRAALCGSDDQKFLKKLVGAFKDASLIKPQDLRAWYSGLLANGQGQNLAWNWIRDDWTWLEATVGGDMSFTSYLTVTANILATKTRLQEFKEFFLPKQNQPGLGREITMDINVIENRVNLISQQKKAVLAQLLS